METYKRCIIKVYDSYCKLENFDDKLIKAIDSELSFKISGSEFMRINGWDGKKYLLNSDLTFKYGLLNRVKDLINKFNIQYEIINYKSNIETNKININTKLAAINKIPYPYQIEAANKVFKNNCGILRMATGSGKSLTMMLMIANLGITANIYVIGKDLLYQMYELCKNIFYDLKIGIIGDGQYKLGDINIVSIWTIGMFLGLKKSQIFIDDLNNDETNIDPNKLSCINDALKNAKMHIFDECHIASCETVQTIVNSIKPYYIFGMSATPKRDDNQDLMIEQILGNKIIDISAKKLIEEGYLVKPLIKFLPVQKYPYKSGKYKTIYSKYIIENDIRNDMIVKGAKKLVEQNFQTLVLFHNISHGKILFEKISKEIPCSLLSGKDDSKKRAKVKENLEAGKIQCIIASKIYDMGIDVPSLSGLVLAGGGKSSVRALQRVGRVIRKAENKTNAAVIDFADQAPYLLEHSKIRHKIYSTEFDTIWPE